MNRLGDPVFSPLVKLLAAIDQQTSWDNPLISNAEMKEAQSGSLNWFKNVVLRRAPAQVNINLPLDTSMGERPAVVEAVLQRCTEVDAGARNVDHILSGTLLPGIATAILQRMSEAVPIARIKVGAGRQGQFKYTIK